MPPTEQKPPEFSEDFHGNQGQAERLRRLVQQSPKDRLKAMSDRVNDPSKCEYCGSTWFAELTFNQYSADAYSAAPGGDIQPISLMPMAPNLGGASLGGRTPNENVSSFNGSLRVAAAKILERATPVMANNSSVDEAIHKVAQRLAKIEGAPSDATIILELQKRLTTMEGASSDLRAKVSTPPAPAAAAAGKVRAKAGAKGEVPSAPEAARE